MINANVEKLLASGTGEASTHGNRVVPVGFSIAHDTIVPSHTAATSQPYVKSLNMRAIQM